MPAVATDAATRRSRGAGCKSRCHRSIDGVTPFDQNLHSDRGPALLAHDSPEGMSGGVIGGGGPAKGGTERSGQDGLSALFEHLAPRDLPDHVMRGLAGGQSVTDRFAGSRVFDLLRTEITSNLSPVAEVSSAARLAQWK